MIDLDRIQIARAEEQMASVRFDEPVTHDPWAIKGWAATYRGRRNTWRREKCLGCGAPPYRGSSYCRLCGSRVRAGLPYDLELWVITGREAQRLSSGIRFGGGIAL